LYRKSPGNCSTKNGSEKKIDNHRIKKMFMKKLLLPFIVLSYSLASYGQEGKSSLNDTVQVGKEDMSASAPPVMAKKWNQFRTKYFTLNIGGCILLDHNTGAQDDKSIDQVGKTGPATEFRGDRLLLTGQLLFFKNPWRYMIGANYNGLDAPQDDKTYSFIDWNLEVPIGKKSGWLTLGKQKEGVGFEYYSPGSQLFFTERGSGTPALVRQRNIGIRYSNSVLKQRLIYTMGAFNNYWETGRSFSANGSQVTGRVVYLASYKSDRQLTHIGVAYQYSESTEGEMSYKAKPESNTAPSYINTGAISAYGSNTIMLELIQVHGPLSFVGEYMHNMVNAQGSDLTFGYYQVGASWFITGENRRYNRLNGVLGKLIPKKNFNFKKNPGPGAFELGARYTHSDFSDMDIDGGRLGRFTAALGWYPNAHFRFEINYGNSSLEKGNITGRSDFWQYRAQFEL
jgi:phosphate-selective porin OprO and OprP